MVRKTKADAEQTYTALLDAAATMFKEKGVASTTLHDIATSAGMTRGAIYWHFKDKSELLHALCERATLPMEALFNQVTAVNGDDPLAAIHTLTVQALKQVAQSPQQRAVFDILFHKCEKTGDMAPLFERERHSRGACHNQMESLFKRAVQLGQLPPHTNTALAVRALHAYMIGLMHEWLLEPSAYDLGAFADALVHTLIGGLRAAPPPTHLPVKSISPANTCLQNEKIAA